MCRFICYFVLCSDSLSIMSCCLPPGVQEGAAKACAMAVIRGSVRVMDMCTLSINVVLLLSSRAADALHHAPAAQACRATHAARSVHAREDPLGTT
jgi:hypothetical protein